MANKKKKSSKKNVGNNKVAVIVAVVVVLVIIAIVAALYFGNVGGTRELVNELVANYLESADTYNSTSTLSDNNNENGGKVDNGKTEGKDITENGGKANQQSGEASAAELTVHFLELGNYETGDCVLLDCGDVEILIDAGSIQRSAGTIKAYVDRYCTDGVLEYVIATHAHQDHIAGFVGTNAYPGIFASYECKTIIDFALTDATSTIYTKYVSARDREVENGATHYTAAQCIKGEEGAKSEYQIADGVKMTILDSYFYYNRSGDENNYSVCVLVENGTQHYLFTGDLEAEGEAKLVEMNELPHCELFKGGHHGSYTSSSEALLAAITPDTVCICCCAGSPEYARKYPEHRFPAVESLTRIVQYTTDIYVTSMYTGDFQNNNSFASFNGNIVVSFEEGKLKVNCSNNNVPLPKTEWCKTNRPTIYIEEK